MAFVGEEDGHDPMLQEDLVVELVSLKEEQDLPVGATFRELAENPAKETAHAGRLPTHLARENADPHDGIELMGIAPNATWNLEGEPASASRARLPATRMELESHLAKRVFSRP